MLIVLSNQSVHPLSALRDGNFIQPVRKIIQYTTLLRSTKKKIELNFIKEN